MNAELFMLRVVLASVLETSITATNKMANNDVLIPASYLERKIIVKGTWPGSAPAATMQSNTAKAQALELTGPNAGYLNPEKKLGFARISRAHQEVTRL